MPDSASTGERSLRSGPALVALAASASSIGALREFFAAIPVDASLSYVVFPQVDEQAGRLSREALSATTTMPVEDIAGTVRVLPGHVYIAPHDSLVSVGNGLLAAQAPPDAHEAESPFRHFCEALARTEGSRAICVVLSNTGEDASAGLREVKALGGAVIAAQELAQQWQPPAMSLVDRFLPVTSIPESVMALATGLYRADLTVSRPGNGKGQGDETLEEANRRLQRKVQELQEANDDLNSLLSNMETAAVFLDTSLRIRRFSEAATEVLGLTPSGDGPQLWHESDRIKGADILSMAEGVLKSGAGESHRVKSDDGRAFLLKVTPSKTSAGETNGVAVALADVTPIQRAVLQQSLLVELGHDVARGAGLQELFDKAVEVVASGLGVEYAKVLQLIPEDDKLLLRAAVGLSQELVNTVAITASPELQPGYTLTVDTPLIVEDATEERRFRLPPLMEDQGVMSGASVNIHGRGARPFGVLIAFSRVPRKFDGDDVRLLSSTAAFLSTAIAVRWEESLRAESERQFRELADELELRVEDRTRVLQNQQRQLRELNARILTAEEDERRRIAEGLHDDVQQLLAAAHYGLQTLLQRPGPILPDEAEELAEWVGESLAATRSFIFDLSPSVLYEEGLTKAIGHLAEQMQRRYHLSVQVIEPAAVDPVPENARVFMYSAIRELLFNVVKHAGVQQAKIHLWRSDGEIQVTVQDNGKGMGTEFPSQKAGMGLTSLRERAQHFGGQLLVESSPEQGTAVTLTLPLPEKEFGSDGDPDSHRG